jgi:DNA-binding GntR family transcriptional regulator
MDVSLKSRDLEAWVRADERFHRMIVDLCGNRRLKSIADGLWDQGHRARITTVRLRSQLERSNREHRLVVRAIRRGDWEEARARHVEHRARTSREIADLLQEYRLARR